MGLKLSLALLWTAVSTKEYLKFDYHTPQPCMVFDRTNKRNDLHVSCQVSLSLKSNANIITDLINEILSDTKELDPRLLISMELFTSARLESTERAKFIGLVSSLEPLAIQKSYNNQEIEDLIGEFTSKVNRVKSLPKTIRGSIIGRAQGLKKESISQAIVGFVQQFFPQNPDIVCIVKEAYDIRSSILHDGTFDADLDEKGKKIEDIIRHIYSQILMTELRIYANF